MDKQLHIVFPKDYMETVVQVLEKEGYQVTNRDYLLETFYHWATKEEQKEYTSTALIVDASNDDIPIEVKAEEYIRYLTEIRIFKPNMRLIINLPSQFKHMKQMQRNFMSLNIYDFYFEDNFSVQSLLSWIENPRNLSDLKDLVKDVIIHEKISNEKQDNNKSSNESEVSAQEDKCLQKVEEYEEKEIINKDDRTGDRASGLKKIANSFSFNVNIPKVQKTKVVEKYVTVNQESIAFISVSKGAGSTFHSLNFASYLRDRELNVGVYEYPIHLDGRTYLSDVFGFFEDHGDNEDSKQISIPHLLSERRPIFLEQIPSYQEISFYAVDYNQKPINSFSNEQLLRYLNTGKHTIKIMDCGFVPSDYFKELSFVDFLSFFHHIVVIVDCMPTMINPNIERLSFFQQLKEDDRFQTKISFLINRYDSYMPKKELKYVNLSDAHRCSSLPYDHIFKALYDKKIPYDISEDIEQELYKIYNGLLEDLQLEEELHYKKKRKRGFFNKIGK
ncbi:hypothetical protein WMO40_20675 [Bacillaceae bacterium CLA-AA-H227]|uniref:Uncharacterized protein n=1 Tax=Robertmurraya yapensis (ex Hitch et al 2024) TaxID=3133160 RepID=A0ACC6SGD1_9BACI